MTPCLLLVMFSTIVVRPPIIVLITGRESHSVMIVTHRGQRVSGVAMVTPDMESVVVCLVIDPEVVVFSEVFLSAPVFHVDSQFVWPCGAIEIAYYSLITLDKGGLQYGWHAALIPYIIKTIVICDLFI